MEVWGTFAVNDHLLPQAFLREVLLFDRLVVPVPSSDEERKRWFAPNPDDPDESWNPDRLDELLAVLGTQDAPGYNGSRLVQTSPWDLERWQSSKSKPEIADAVSMDSAFGATRLVLAQNDPIPAVAEAVAAYPSPQACRTELHPADDAARVPAGEALVMLARTLLVPTEYKDPLEALREAVDLARELEDARAAYHEWLRGFVGAMRLNDVVLDDYSLGEAKENLNKLLAKEREVIARDQRKRRWTKVEYATMVVGAGVGIAVLLLAPPVAPLALSAAGLQFGGWVASKRADVPEPSPLSGASLFLSAQQTHGWEP